MKKEFVHTRLSRDGETTVMIYYQEGEGWEIYYKREMFPFLFAFCLSAVYDLNTVFSIADDNIMFYQDMFV